METLEKLVDQHQENLPQFTTEELLEIVNEYNCGRCKQIELDFPIFIEHHIEKIYRHFDKNRYLPKDVAFVQFVIKNQTLNASADIQEETVEIEKAIWIDGVDNNRSPNREEVAKNWTKKHASPWRQHHVLKLIYMFEKHKTEYLSLIDRRFSELNWPSIYMYALPTKPNCNAPINEIPTSL